MAKISNVSVCNLDIGIYFTLSVLGYKYSGVSNNSKVDYDQELY
jgi:hypothetical protein